MTFDRLTFEFEGDARGVKKSANRYKRHLLILNTLANGLALKWKLVKPYDM